MNVVKVIVVTVFLVSLTATEILRAHGGQRALRLKRVSMTGAWLFLLPFGLVVLTQLYDLAT